VNKKPRPSGESRAERRRRLAERSRLTGRGFWLLPGAALVRRSVRRSHPNKESWKGNNDSPSGWPMPISDAPRNNRMSWKRLSLLKQTGSYNGAPALRGLSGLRGVKLLHFSATCAYSVKVRRGLVPRRRPGPGAEAPSTFERYRAGFEAANISAEQADELARFYRDNPHLLRVE
jgi:hypothetical protein